jgi:hypothetical protein
VAAAAAAAAAAGKPSKSKSKAAAAKAAAALSSAKKAATSTTTTTSKARPKAAHATGAKRPAPSAAASSSSAGGGGAAKRKRPNDKAAGKSAAETASTTTTTAASKGGALQEEEDGSYSRLQQLQHVQELYDRHKRDFERLLARLEKVDKFGFFLDPVPPHYDEGYDPSSPKPPQAVAPPSESIVDKQTTAAPPPVHTSTPTPQVTLELERSESAVSAATAAAEAPSTPMHVPIQPSAAAAVSSPLDFLASAAEAAAAVGTTTSTAAPAAAASTATAADTNFAVVADVAADATADAAPMPPKKKPRRRPPANKAPARAALVFPDHAPFNWAMVRRRMEHGRYVLDREKYLRGQGGRRVAGMRRKALPPLHRLGVDWDLFVKDVVGMCDMALENDEEDDEEAVENVVDGAVRDNGGAEAGTQMLDGDTEKSNLGGTATPALPKSPPRLERGSLAYAVKLIKDVRTGGPCFANDSISNLPSHQLSIVTCRL